MIKKHLDLIIVGFFVLSIVMYDVTIDFLLNALHLIFEVLHIAFEWFELGIEHTVEHLFHTTRHGSQIVTFYILLLIAGLVAYWLWRILPRLYEGIKQILQQVWIRRKTEWEVYWFSLTLTNKIRLLSTLMGIVCLTSFFAM